MSVEVVDPAWHTLATEIAGCSTVDEVLAKHGDFLNCCLHDCLLYSPQLLATVKKLLGVCSDFAVYMQSLGVRESPSPSRLRTPSPSCCRCMSLI